MTTPSPPRSHADVVRDSFRRQVPLFTGPDSPFASRERRATEWVEPLRPDMAVLDVACGAAHVAETIAGGVRTVVGIDLTPDLLEIGAARLRDAGIDNVLLQEGDAEAMPFVSGSFDLVCCRSSLHHFERPRRAVEEMVRVCRVGGRVVVSDLVVASAEVRGRCDELHRLLDPSHRSVFTEPELLALVPGGIAVTRHATSTGRMALDVVVTEQSDREALEAAFRSEIDGAPASGFEPAVEDGSLTVAFTTCTVEATLGA